MRIAIIGCGPAGLSAAIALQQNHFDVTVFDQFDQPRPVGSGLVIQPTGLAVLDTFDLKHKAESLGQRINGMLGRLAPNGKTVLDIKYSSLSGDLYGLAIHRASLFQVLLDSVLERNIPMISSCRISSLTRLSNGRFELHTDACKHSEEFDLIVDASGANSAVMHAHIPDLKKRDLSFGALWTTVKLTDFKADLLEQRYVKANKMVGVLPCGTLPGEQTRLATLFYSIEAHEYGRWQTLGLDHWKAEMRSLWPEVKPLIDQITEPEQLTFASYSHHTLKPPVREGVVFIGDTAHATSPQLGQGANMALLDALALTTALKSHCGNGLHNLPQALDYYASLRRNHVRLYQTVSYLLTPFYQSNSNILPFLRDTFFEPVTSIGFMNRFITRLGAGTLTNPASQLIVRYNTASQYAKAR